jgi:ParB-like chromosome segregation protein Spo0J
MAFIEKSIREETTRPRKPGFLLPMNHPIENIQWLPVDELESNDYNPNVVFNQELKLLEHSLLESGWIQPILVCENESGKYTIIDGFHRWSLTKLSKRINEMSKGKVPCAVLKLSEAERMLLTVRINRAKGSHVALKMHDLVTSLIKEYGLSVEDVCKGLGASKDEVNLLLAENVFKKLDIQNHKYSKAWVPK